jgi:uncharacterized membrane protein HdeD (DUF308 family)
LGQSLAQFRPRNFLAQLGNDLASDAFAATVECAGPLGPCGSAAPDGFAGTRSPPKHAPCREFRHVECSAFEGVQPKGQMIMNRALQCLADRWWVPLLRGLVAVLFGVLTFLMPGAGLFALVILWAAYTLTDGAVSVVYAIAEHKRLPGWGWVLFSGLTGLGAAAVTFAWPGTTALVLLFTIAAWAVVIGAMQLGAAIAWRREVSGVGWLVLSGVLSIAFGASVFAFPGAGALSLAWLISGYAVAFGVTLLGLSARLYRLGHPGGRGIPPVSAHPA